MGFEANKLFLKAWTGIQVAQVMTVLAVGCYGHDIGSSGNALSSHAIVCQ